MRVAVVVAAMVVVAGWGGAIPVWAQEAQQPPGPVDKPEREVVVAFDYPGKVVEDDASLSLELIIKNNGAKDETVFLDVAKTPPNWEAKIKTYSAVVTGVFVPAGETKTLTFSADETDDDDKLTPGQYVFEVKASTEDGQISATATSRITVEVKEEGDEEEGEEDRPVRITTSYPVLRGSSESDFEFSVDIHNGTEEDDMFSLRAEAPEGWDVAFKPSYESKYIGSLEITSNLSKSVKVEIGPPRRAEVGEYPIKVFAKCSQGEAERELTVVLTGTHKLSCRTVNDVLSLAARKGEQANVSIYVVNEGSAPQQEITFTSFKPENWEVEFEPERVEGIEPGGMAQVEITITPAAEALVGDYSVAVSARGEDADDDIEFRVTMKAATLWAWIGVGIIIVVIVGLAVMFKVLGRR